MACAIPAKQVLSEFQNFHSIPVAPQIHIQRSRSPSCKKPAASESEDLYSIKFGVYIISALKYSCEKARLVPTNRLAEYFFKEFGPCPQKKIKQNQRGPR
jgi:hypothetical protein